MSGACLSWGKTVAIAWKPGGEGILFSWPHAPRVETPSHLAGVERGGMEELLFQCHRYQLFLMKVSRFS